MTNTIKEKLALHGGKKTIESPSPHFVWPLITEETRKAILNQLNNSISYYKKQGVFERFENRFAEYHNRKYGLLHNSGTSALHAMYVGIGLEPGDEVICPTYTFPATVTPMLFTGARPIFCDAGIDGNINPDKIRELITEKTKAIIITHMWGIPCEMDKITEITKEFDIKLLEDCSHAHGATFDKQVVGTFGNAAIWSLQGQKTLTGGEGGILVTDEDEIYYKSLLLGHYNKRCKEEINVENPLSKISLTGLGLKLRAHPLAIAIADQQFDNLDAWLKQRRGFAEKIIEELKPYTNIVTLPDIQRREPSWYAFTIQFNVQQSEGVTVNDFYRALQAEGLLEMDIPHSTKPIHEEPIFQNMDMVNPAAYKENKNVEISEYPIAEKFYTETIKFPVWARSCDTHWIEKYIEGIKKVLDNIHTLKNQQ